MRGHKAHVVHDGRLAADAAREFEPDIVLLDIGLPGMDGYQVVRQFRSVAGPRDADDRRDDGLRPARRQAAMPRRGLRSAHRQTAGRRGHRGARASRLNYRCKARVQRPRTLRPRVSLQQKLQRRHEPFRPVCFLVPSPFTAANTSDSPWDVPFPLEQPAASSPRVPHGSGAFVGSDVDDRAGRGGSVPLHIVDQRAVPNHNDGLIAPVNPNVSGARKNAYKADQTAHRRAEDARGLAFGPRPDAPIDERFQRALDERQIGVASAAAMPASGERAVLAHPLDAAVRNADDDRLQAAAAQACAAHASVSRFRRTHARVRQILAVLHVDRRIAAAVCA